jgi:hypothetical protein
MQSVIILKAVLLQTGIFLNFELRFHIDSECLPFPKGRPHGLKFGVGKAISEFEPVPESLAVLDPVSPPIKA